MTLMKIVDITLLILNTKTTTENIMKNDKLYAISFVFSLFISTNSYAQNNQPNNIQEDFSLSEVETINRSSAFELDLSPTQTLPLFTAQGEKLWAPGWQPILLSGEGYEQGNVWITKQANSTTYWHISRYDTLLHEAVYTFVKPNLLMGTVSVMVTENTNNGSLVNVTYNLTALSEKGNNKLRTQYSRENYPKMIAEWKMLIMDYLDKIKVIR